jgi:hypothetical protein
VGLVTGAAEAYTAHRQGGCGGDSGWDAEALDPASQLVVEGEEVLLY